MKKKRISLATQYTFNALIVFMILTTYIVSREGFGFKQYEPIISKFYYMGLILYGLIGLIRQNEKIDESAERVLGKVTGICLYVSMLGLIILTIIMGAPMYKKLNITRDVAGLLILALLFIVTSLRAILFYYFDRKGL